MGFDLEEVIFDGVTCFIGENGSGKSTLGFRATKILIQGENFKGSWIKSGKSKSTITGWFNHPQIKSIVRWRNSKGAQGTDITYKDGKVVSYSGSKDSAEIIRKIFSVKESTPINGISLNTYNKRTESLVLGRKPEQVQFALNTILGTDLFEKSKKDFEGLIRDGKKDLNYQRSRKSYEERNLKIIEEKITSLNETYSKVDTLNKLIKEKQAINKAISLKAFIRLDKVSDLINLLNEKFALVRTVKLTSQIDFINKVESQIQKLVDLSTTKTNLYADFLFIKTLKVDIDNFDSQLKDVEDRLSNIPLCDFCGQPI